MLLTHRILPVLLLAACAQESSASWIRDASFQWNLTNHRLSAWAARPAETEGVEVELVGGASTTGVWFEDPEGACNAEGTCFELPTFDDAIVAATRVDAVSTAVRLETVPVVLELPVGGDTPSAASTRIELGASGAAPVAWIGWVDFDLQAPLSDAATALSCYDPRHGWLPKRLAVEVAVDEGSPDAVEVSARFESGLTYEEARSCLDAIADLAAATITLEVVVASGGYDEVVSVPLQQGATWPWRPGDGEPDQSLSEIGELDADLPADALIGWRKLDFTFHETVEPGRGAYLRTLSWTADPELGQAWGLAQNRAPEIFLQSGFDYAFEGEVVGVTGDVDVSVTRWGADELPAAVTDEGEPVVQELEPAP